MIIIPKDYSDYLLQLVYHQKYSAKIMENRNEFKKEAMITRPDKIHEKIKMDRSPLNLVYHGLQPLYINCQRIESIENKSVDFGLNKLNLKDKLKEFIEVYKHVNEYSQKQLSSVDLYKLEGSLENIRGDEQKFRERLVKLTSHSLHHMGQVVLLHGMICNVLLEMKG